MKSTEEYISFLRNYKHDILNQMQVIQGYLQLNKAEKAKVYVKEAIEEIKRFGAIMSLGLGELAWFLLNKQVDLREQGIELELINEGDFSGLSQEEEQLLVTMESLICKVVNLFEQKNVSDKKLEICFEGNDPYEIIISLPEVSGIEWKQELESIKFTNINFYITNLV